MSVAVWRLKAAESTGAKRGELALLFLFIFRNRLIDIDSFDGVYLFVIREDIITAFIVAKKNSDALKANPFFLDRNATTAHGNFCDGIYFFTVHDESVCLLY